MNTSNLKDKLTTYLAFAIIIAQAIDTYLTGHAGQPINWTQMVIAVCLATVSYITGKNPDGSKKTLEQTAKLNNPAPISNPITDATPLKS